MFFSFQKYILYPGIYLFWFFSAQGSESIHSSISLKVDSAHCVSEQDHLSGCEDLYRSGISDSDEGSEKLNQIYKDQILEYFLDIVFENAFCRCEGNNGCTRGCRLASLLNREQYPTIRKCVGKKPRHISSANCAKHVTGAIMAVLHDFLAEYCKSTDDRIFWATMNYQQCDKSFRRTTNNNNANICRHGFIFPAAYCMLNLDGQSSRVYNSISNRGVRRICKRWNQYNQSLLNIEVLLENGEIKKVPLFKRISPERNKEFQRHPDRIPTGAIIITKLYRKEGHVEVKTDWNECGKDKTQTCFCSDYCQERLRYSYPVLAVFEWNPEFIKYVNNYRFKMT